MKRVIQLEKQLDAKKKQRKILMDELNKSIMNDDSHLTDYHLLIKKMDTQENRNREHWAYESEKEAQNWLACIRILKHLLKCYENDCKKILSLIKKVHTGPLAA